MFFCKKAFSGAISPPRYKWLFSVFFKTSSQLVNTMFTFMSTVYYISDHTTLLLFSIRKIWFPFYTFLIKTKHFSYQKHFVQCIKTADLSNFLYRSDSFYFILIWIFFMSSAKAIMCHSMLELLYFILILFYFNLFSLIWFFFFFYFISWKMKRHVTAVIWCVTWHNVIGLESGRRYWRIISRCMLTVYSSYRKHIDIRVGLFIISTDHMLLVYIV